MIMFFPPSLQSRGVTLRLRRVATGGEAYAKLKSRIAHVESGEYMDTRRTSEMTLRESHFRSRTATRHEPRLVTGYLKG
jgi:hypothetical protein